MKLKNVLMITFLALTITPIVIISILLYRSGFDLAKASYTTNLTESLNVQVDYITQTIENNMISDYRFANQNIAIELEHTQSTVEKKSELYNAITSYLRGAEDRINVGVLLDKNHQSIYSIGEKRAIDVIQSQIPQPSEFTSQTVLEFNLEDDSQSLGIVTPVWKEDTYLGCLISVYDKSYVFKIISSYYEIADTSTYVCRENGDVINSRQFSNDKNEEIERTIKELNFSSEGKIEANNNNLSLSGYYKRINNTPWYLVGFVDDQLIYSFTNKFLLVYILIIIGVLCVDIILSFYFSRRVVKPINRLIGVMEGYRHSLDAKELQYQEEGGYVETKYLRTKFLELMQKIILTQHNFEGIYQLYQSSDMGDINIDIDVTNQKISSNKGTFQTLINEVEVPKGACIVERFTHCFCEKDQQLLLNLFEEMRDEHLSTNQETEVYTPYFDGKWYQILVVPMYTNERLSRLFIQLRDVSNFRMQEIESSERAKRDVLTGLFNRAGFIYHVDKILQASSKEDLHALLFIDMDYFKLVNDTLGHAKGDDLLCSIGKRISKLIRSSDIVSRFGGDEFAVFLTHTSMEGIEKKVKELKEVLIYPFEKEGFVVSASIGVSTWHHDSPDTLENLLQKADSAMYKSKRDFKQDKTKEPPRLN